MWGWGELSEEAEAEAAGVEAEGAEQRGVLKAPTRNRQIEKLL